MTPQTITTTETLALAIQTPLNRPKLSLTVKLWNADTCKWVMVTDMETRRLAVEAMKINGDWSTGSYGVVVADSGRYLVEAW